LSALNFYLASVASHTCTSCNSIQHVILERSEGSQTCTLWDASPRSA